MYCSETIVDCEGNSLEIDGGWQHDDELTIHSDYEVNLNHEDVTRLIEYLTSWVKSRTFSQTEAKRGED